MVSEQSEARPLRKPSQARALRTRAALVSAGKCEFSERGYAAATARSIAARAKVATGSFYQYFADKDALLRELARERLSWVGERSLAILEPDPLLDDADLPQEIRRRMRQVVALVVEYHREDPGLHAVLTERRHTDKQLDELTAAAERGLIARVSTLLERWNSAGDTEATAFVLFGMMEGSIHSHVLGTAVVSDDRFTEALVGALHAVAYGLRPGTSG